jgi:hypothetical protein
MSGPVALCLRHLPFSSRLGRNESQLTLTGHDTQNPSCRGHLRTDCSNGSDIPLVEWYANGSQLLLLVITNKQHIQMFVRPKHVGEDAGH